MVTAETYKLIQKYAKKVSKSPNDIDDIVQESCYLFIKNPVDGNLPKRFYFVLVKRGAFRFYFNSNTKELINKDVVLSKNDYDSLVSAMSSDTNIEMECAYAEIKEKLESIPVKNHSHFHTGITHKESELLLKILNSYEPGYEDRTIFNNLRKKLVAFFS